MSEELMFGRVVEYVQHSFYKKPFPLGSELKNAVEKVMETGEAQVIDKGWGQYIVESTERGIRIKVRAHVATFEVLTKDYVREKYKDIIEFMREKGTVSRKELRKKFFLLADEFIEAAKVTGIVRSTSRGYRLVEEGRS
ncbi:hypothetical protein E3E36_10815 [Thermococcus sp. M36]|nr:MULTISPECIES: hypothetical protein [unclassified Thermococcus]NJE06617.1 hypothetical protein [Thermococcus sp. M36]NJE55661.1 hypothetical protein [Thermococcus sp. 21S9]